MKNTGQAFSLLIVFIIGQAFLSCSTIKNADFSKRRYMERPYVIKHKIGGESNEDLYASTGNTLSGFDDDPGIIALLKQNTAYPEPVSNRLYNKLIPLAEEMPAYKEEALAHIENFTTNNRIEKKQIRKLIRREIKELVRYHRENNDLPGINDDRFLLELVLSFLLPPLAVYLHYDVINDFFWISLVLTLLFWIPGVIFALLVITDTI